jgi:hypothetical protein
MKERLATSDGSHLITTDGYELILSFIRTNFTGFDYPLTVGINIMSRTSPVSDKNGTVLIDQ